MPRDAALALWQFLAKRLRAKEKVLLLLVAESVGSSPGRAGFKMVVAADGTLCGSIGGGIMEIKLAELAKAALQQNPQKPWCKRQIHRKNAAHDQSGMICSGEQHIIFLPLFPEDLKQVRHVIRCLKGFIPAVLQVTANGWQVLQNRKNAQAFHFEHPSDQAFLFEENLGFQNRLYLIGGGHCALALSALFSRLDFFLCLFDDRPALNTFSQNDFVHRKEVLYNYDRIGEYIPEGDDVYVVIMTVGYRTDELVIRQLLDKNFRYIGVLGSAAKMQTLLNKLREEGIPEAKLSRLRTPVGLPINSRTPEEIAISIAAEVIAVKNSPSTGGSTTF